MLGIGCSVSSTLTPRFQFVTTLFFFLFKRVFTANQIHTWDGQLLQWQPEKHTIFSQHFLKTQLSAIPLHVKSGKTVEMRSFKLSFECQGGFGYVEMKKVRKEYSKRNKEQEQNHWKALNVSKYREQILWRRIPVG